MKKKGLINETNEKELLNYISNMDQVKKLINSKIKSYGIRYQNNNQPTIIKKDWNNQRVNAYVVTLNSKQFKYYEGVGHKPLSDNKTEREAKILNLLNCLLVDYDCANITIEEYIATFGEINQAAKLLKQIKANSKKLEEIFTIEEIQFLRDNIQL